MVMANSLARQNGSSTPEKVIPDWALSVAEALADGQSVSQIARKLAKGDKAAAQRWRKRIRRLAWNDARLKAALAATAEAELQLGLPASAKAIASRAGRGRPDAAKLTWAATGFHNEKVSHEHSGDIQINVSIPRPQTTVDEIGPGKDYVDAEVVEE